MTVSSPLGSHCGTKTKKITLPNKMVIYFNLDHNSHSYYIFIYIWNHQLQQPCFIYNLNMVVVLQCKIHQSFFKLFWVFPWQCCDDKSKKAQWKGTEMLTLLSSLNCWSLPKIWPQALSKQRLKILPCLPEINLKRLVDKRSGQRKSMPILSKQYP